MDTALNIDVASLDAPHRRALEDVLGHALATHQRLVINVIEWVDPPTATARPAQSLDDWTSVYAGLTDDEIEAIDQITHTRAELTRNEW